MIVRIARPDEIPAIQALVHEVFMRDVAPCYGIDGVDEFGRYNALRAYYDRQVNNHDLLVATRDGSIVGMLEMRETRHISLLFVTGALQRKGVGRALLREALEIVAGHNSLPAEVTVNSSPNAVEGYLRMGFELNGSEQVVNGIRYQPMIYVLHGR